MIARGLSSSSEFSEKSRTFGRQWSCPAIQSCSWSANAGRSRNRCFVSRKTGGWPSILRARLDQVDRVELVAAVVALVAARLGKPQIGHVPSM